MKRLNAIVTGRVQAVGYRNFAWKAARNLPVLGYVRNLPDGNVEVVAEGPHAALEALLEKLHKGPLLSRVIDVRTEYASATGEFNEFVVRY